MIATENIKQKIVINAIFIDFSTELRFAGGDLFTFMLIYC